MGWLRLNEATSLIDHDVQKARAALEREISKARPGGVGDIPYPTSDPNVPLRILVMPLGGGHFEGRAWLDSPVLYWDESEIECLGPAWGPPWDPPTQVLPPTPNIQMRATIEVWE